MVVRIFHLREDIACQRVRPVTVEAELTDCLLAAGMDADGPEGAQPLDAILYASGPFSGGTDAEMMAGAKVTDRFRPGAVCPDGPVADARYLVEQGRQVVQWSVGAACLMVDMEDVLVNEAAYDGCGVP